jgi:hypothetical protein
MTVCSQKRFEEFEMNREPVKRYSSVDAWPAISPIGFSQAMNGEIVMNPSDRREIAKILLALNNSLTAQAAIRHEYSGISGLKYETEVIVMK